MLTQSNVTTSKSLRSWIGGACGIALMGLLCCAPAAWSADGYGKLSGVVIDPAGTPQMGATILLTAETADGVGGVRLLTDQEGVFSSVRLRPGLYSLRATLAGFLPTIQQHVRVSANLTTLVNIELDSVFTSLDQLRHPSGQASEKDDWKWVLRTSSASRPVLQLLDGTVVIADDNTENAELRRQDPHALVKLTNGSSYPGSPSALPGALTTAVSYDQSLGPAGRLLIAGQMSYDHTNGYNPAPGGLDQNLAGGLATIWIPSGKFGRGPQTTVVVRQAHLPRGDRSLRMMRLEHSEQLVIGGRTTVDYGAEYLGGGIGRMTSSVRPRARIGMAIMPGWTASVLLETDPASYSLRSRGDALESAMDALGTLPTLLWKNGRAVLSGGWHEEVALKRTAGKRGIIEAATFYDYSRDQAVFGFDSQRAFAWDAGPGGSMGTRAVYRERISRNLEVAGIYSWAGALAPVTPAINIDNNLQDGVQDGMRDGLRMRYRSSVAGRVSGRIPVTGTQFTASYKWLDGPVASRQDLYGEASLGVDPYLSMTIRQPLPGFRTSGHWEALVDVRNLLSQGALPTTGEQGAIVVMPVERSFRGGVSFQF
jgi:Carboxypeptidase regulatory-like domain